VGNAGGRYGDISPDGRYVIFDSGSTNLIVGEVNGTGGMFMHDRQTRQTSRVTNDGEEGAVSGGGRYVAFVMLVRGDPDTYQIYVKDLQTGLTTLVSKDSGGNPGNDWSGRPDISDDGRYIVYSSSASNLVGDDTNEAGDIFVYDQQTGTNERISVASDGTQGDAGSGDQSISGDGRFVAFTSNATNLVTGDTNGRADVFVRDRVARTITRVSVNSGGGEADRGARDSSISSDGRFVSFSSFSTNLMVEDSLEFEHVYVHDRQTGATTLASRYTEGYPMQGQSEQSVISGGGRFVAFQFDDRGDSMPIFVIVVHDRQTGLTKYVTHGRGPGGGWSADPTFSADGMSLIFTSDEILVSGDTNGSVDVYLHEVAMGPDPSPTVSSVQYVCGSGCPYPTPPMISFRVTFSELVTGVTVEDFSLTAGGGVTGAMVTGVSGNANEYLVTVNTGIGDGTLRLDVQDDDSVRDVSLNPLGGAGAGNGNFTTGEVYIVDKNIPTVLGVTRLDANPAGGPFVHFAIAFSEEVTGLDNPDLVPYPSGTVSGASVVEVTGSGRNYIARVSTGTGEGTLKLNVIDNDSIRDGNNHSIGGDGPDNGTYTSGEVYTIDRIPSVMSILRLDPNPTAAESVNFKVTFSEAVAGVDPGDFSMAISGTLAGSSIVSVNPPSPGTEFIVLVNPGSGSGTLRLDLVDNDSIIDGSSQPLGGLGQANGSFSTGDAYTINRTVRQITSVHFRSNGTNDGWVLETSEEAGTGGTVNAHVPLLILGDDAQDRQFRSILHFPTQHLPDNAVITQAILAVKLHGIAGNDPFLTHGKIAIDLQSGYFGSAGFFGMGSLDPTDFQSPATLPSAGSISNSPVGGWYWTILQTSAYPFINLQGITQLRLRFEAEDNDDLGEDLIGFYSGDYELISERPRLIIEYYLQR